jgi:hypothetical protein
MFAGGNRERQIHGTAVWRTFHRRRWWRQGARHSASCGSRSGPIRRKLPDSGLERCPLQRSFRHLHRGRGVPSWETGVGSGPNSGQAGGRARAGSRTCSRVEVASRYSASPSRGVILIPFNLENFQPLGYWTISKSQSIRSMTARAASPIAAWCSPASNKRTARFTS